MSGSGGVPTAKDYGSGMAGVAMDPFTGSGAYVSGSSDMDVSPSNAGMSHKNILLSFVESKLIKF